MLCPQNVCPYIPKSLSKIVALHPKYLNKVLLCTYNDQKKPKRKVLHFTQNLWTKLLLCTKNVWKKSFFALKMFGKKSCIALQMFEQKSFFAPQTIDQKSPFSPMFALNKIVALHQNVWTNALQNWAKCLALHSKCLTKCLALHHISLNKNIPLHP